MINIVYRLKSPKFFEEAIDNIELKDVVVRPTYLSICQADQRYYQVQGLLMFYWRNCLWP